MRGLLESNVVIEMHQNKSISDASNILFAEPDTRKYWTFPIRSGSIFCTKGYYCLGLHDLQFPIFVVQYNVFGPLILFETVTEEFLGFRMAVAPPIASPFGSRRTICD